MQNGNGLELCCYVKSKITANTSSDYVDINITVAMMTTANFQQLKVLFTSSQEFCCYFCIRIVF